MKPTIEVKASEGTQTLIIREGQALPLEPRKVEIKGIIDTPFTFLQKRKDLLDLNSAHILVDRDNQTINLVTDETNQYNTIVEGKLELSKEFLMFKINTMEYENPIKLSEFFKMHRAFFANKSENANVVSLLKNFKAKVEKDVESEINLNKGDRKTLINKVCEHNAPESFNLRLPIFKGGEKVDIKVETYFDSENYTFCLMSPEVNELIETSKNEILDKVLKQIEELVPTLVIMEV